ncbi:DUF5677 domain-containing protein [Streptomyces sp. NPDC057430]|uniref:DUF5677 domain-containing protein n=1 Tax=Streptomyces sp. NPDC057430 TaxID=3346131 RepID=UPI0036B1D7E3
MNEEEFLKQAEVLVAREIRRAHENLARGDRRRTLIRRRLRRHWGRSLDLYRLTLDYARELGTEVNRQAPTPRDPLTTVLTQIHARGCRVADEVHCLLEAGHAHGALKPARLLYELAVVAYTLADYGRRPEHDDLLDRYLAHREVVSCKAMTAYQNHAAALGQHPYPDEEMDEARRAAEAAKEKFPGVGGQFGWAAPLPGSKGKTTEDLAQLAGIGHLHPYFEWASAETHAGAQGVALNTVRTRRGEVLRAGPSIDGIVDPASLALLCLHHCTVALARGWRPELGPEVWLHVLVVEQLRARTDTALGAVHLKTELPPLSSSR